MLVMLIKTSLGSYLKSLSLNLKEKVVQVFMEILLKQNLENVMYIYLR